MTASTLTVLLANLVLSPETGFISIRFKHPSYGCRIRSLDAGCHVTCREASNHAFCQASVLSLPHPKYAKLM
jgi:hypothetical protein